MVQYSIMTAEYQVERLDGEINNRYSPTILVAADVLATDSWHELVSATQVDYRERGLVVGRHIGKNKLIRSKVIEGYGREQTDIPGEDLEAAFPVPMLPFGVKSLSPRIKQDVVIHTHPMPPEVDHVRTSIISDKDIHAFTNSRYNAMVMLDRGGAHLVARTRQSDLYSGKPQEDLVSSTMRGVIAESGGSMDIMIKLASRLGQYGLGYFYTPELAQPGETVELQNLRVVQNSDV